MMNINFFEKKKRNVLPYIAGGVFFVLAVAIGVYFLLVRANFTKAIEESDQWTADHIEEVAQARQISRFDQMTNQSLATQETLKKSRYPLAVLANNLADLLPNETERVQSFEITESNQVNLILENTTSNQGQSIVEELEAEPYVERVQLLHAQTANAETNQLRFEMIIDINPEYLAEEEAE